MRIQRFNSCAIAVAAVIALAHPLPLSAQVADGDRHWNARAEGVQRVDAAVAAYQRAVAANANDVEAHAKLLRAYRFKGAYLTPSLEGKKQIYGVAKTAGDRALTAVGRALAARGTKPDASEKVVAAAARSIPFAPDVYLWDAINWGEWALAYGKLAAARQGAADRIRREATIAHLAAPSLEGGAASRVLGRLHDQTPRIPLITGWASSKEALRFLNESLTHDPSNKLTQLFLAEAMVANDGRTKPRAIEMLRRIINSPNHPEYALEDAAAVADARALLKRWGA